MQSTSVSPLSELSQKLIERFEARLELAALRAKRLLEVDRLHRLHHRTVHEPSQDRHLETLSDALILETKSKDACG